MGLATHLRRGADDDSRPPMTCTCEGGVLRGIRETHMALQLAHIMSRPECLRRPVRIGGTRRHHAHARCDGDARAFGGSIHRLMPSCRRAPTSSRRHTVCTPVTRSTCASEANFDCQRNTKEHVRHLLTMVVLRTESRTRAGSFWPSRAPPP